MTNHLALIPIRIIDKILFKKRRLVLKNRKRSKNALVSYVLAPRFFLPFYFKNSHNNRYQAFLIAKYLRTAGYNAYLHDYTDDSSVDYSIAYDLFIGHNITFTKIHQRLKGSFKKILLGAGSDPQFGNEQQRIRIAYVNKKKHANLPVYDDNIVPDITSNYETADRVLLLGNDFVRNTYPAVFRKKMELINNVTLHPYFKLGKRTRKNAFLFISSVGLVHRGLDLVLDVFSKLDQKVYILSAFEKEKDFVALYAKELYETPNVIPVGYVPLDTREFFNVVTQCDFVILPSCSEGQSSSVVNLMAYGLIPVIPENVGIPNTAEVGIKIDTLDEAGVHAAVTRAVGLSEEAYAAKINAVQAFNPLFKEQEFMKRLSTLLS